MSLGVIGTKYHTPEIVKRFWLYVEKTDGCWQWSLALNRGGYGRFVLEHNVTAQAHRVAYELTKGEIPRGLSLDHLCRNRGCVNPDHLEPVTHRVNVHRGIGPTAQRHRQTKCKYGHALVGDAVTVRKQGWRTCRECNRRRSQETTAKRRARHKAMGLCAWCPVPRVSGRAYCAGCAAKKLARDRSHQALVSRLVAEQVSA